MQGLIPFKLPHVQKPHIHRLSTPPSRFPNLARFTPSVLPHVVVTLLWVIVVRHKVVTITCHTIPIQAILGSLKRAVNIQHYQDYQEANQADMTLNDQLFLTREESAEILRVSTPTLDKLLREGDIRYRRVGGKRGRVLIPRSEILKFA